MNLGNPDSDGLNYVGKPIRFSFGYERSVWRRRMQQSKGCYARDILGANRISNYWIEHCDIRWKQHVCCRDCGRKKDCSLHCPREFDKECAHYCTAEEFEQRRLSFKLDEDGWMWKSDEAKRKYGAVHVSKKV
jgi:hypothetical protein